MAERAGRYRFRDALRAIAEGRDPCRHCGKPHDWRWHDPNDQKRGGTWADPDDGHSYTHIGAQAYARQVLDG